ncbi:MAG TPA: DUF1839 family protein [Povalibacter sp.]|uniref:DUF1839 family protein n=1 Tax=Povalibacter sp. TaxID=1962978 RepID=UPI002CAC2733|nr:DUF1839 family protein [Povalibacter sp.]HMN42988.1 DUF1839 family protein [Povalibacter sp.]
MSLLSVIGGLDPLAYTRHALHGEERIWVEKNCYIDLWIELLHAMRLEPLAMLPFTAAVDFEDDQWTFYKPSHEELRELYGVDVQELTVWRTLLEHVLEHTAAGRMVSTEADAFWLPDTAGTDYRRQHTKTTIVINEIDVEARTLRYFHNAGYYSLEGEDFVQTFRLDAAPDPAFMPLFAEFVRAEGIVRRPTEQLVALSLQLWQRHLQRIPATNPIPRFRKRFDGDLEHMQQRGLPYYHAWAFASIRQVGSAFELAALNLQWLGANGVANLERAADSCMEIATLNKAFILKAARAVNARRALDSAATFGAMEGAWERAISVLGERVGRERQLT